MTQSRNQTISDLLENLPENDLIDISTLCYEGVFESEKDFVKYYVIKGFEKLFSGEEKAVNKIITDMFNLVKVINMPNNYYCKKGKDEKIYVFSTI